MDGDKREEYASPIPGMALTLTSTVPEFALSVPWELVLALHVVVA